MIINDLLKKKNITKYRLSQISGVPYSTLNDIFNGKTPLPRCKAETVYNLAKALDTTVEFLMEADDSNRCSFACFKSNVCHKLKDLGDIEFLRNTLSSDEIRIYFNRGWYGECFYLLAMTEYLSRIHNIPACSDYSDIRQYKLENPVFPDGIEALCVAAGNDSPKEKALAGCIPEFRRYNLIEGDIRYAC